ncbi:hypothetical protein Asppvi_007774 [Aspergillus pseudoviridinutans]|uniref:Uncharacterized protein n=1 Tax=Aspergillus pseudoviridinutans TaxID=1517512 RepID=A0A9P3BCL2_9EURO|nr:uncharacterized protein Asppvi_007774 [Aspergillus pseudoviridinutans]GIJ88846.1 hypothetical protein Asppvi_007774 [Aspergillus pseudoviridinutans]
MQFATFLLVALLSIFDITVAAPTYHYHTVNPALTWHVSNFYTGCSPEACDYRFDIMGITTPNTPGFNTTCNGTDVETDYSFCRDKHIKAKVTALKPRGWKVEVMHAWFKPGAEFYAEGSANVTSTMRNFTIPVTDTYGAA